MNLLINLEYHPYLINCDESPVKLSAYSKYPHNFDNDDEKHNRVQNGALLVPRSLINKVDKGAFLDQIK